MKPTSVSMVSRFHEEVGVDQQDVLVVPVGVGGDLGDDLAQGQVVAPGEAEVALGADGGDVRELGAHHRQARVAGAVIDDREG
ncbi:MAG: hypothetical protein U0232_12040 [Thermomicrobiales bacterium]